MTLIYTQGRRIAFGGFFFFLSGLLYFGAYGLSDYPIYVVLMSAIFATICMLLSAVGIWIFPGFRHTVEVASVGYFLVQIGESSGLLPYPGWVFNSMNGYMVVFFGFAALHHTFYGRWWRKTGIRLAFNMKSRFKTKLSPEQVWHRLVPNPEAPEDYYTGTLYDYTLEKAPNFYEVKTRLGGSAFSNQIHEVTENLEFQSFVTEFTSETSKANRDLNSGRESVTIEPDRNGGSTVIMTESVRAMTVDLALASWFDNLGQQVRFSAKSVLEGRRDRTTLGRWRRQVLEDS